MPASMLGRGPLCMPCMSCALESCVFSLFIVSNASHVACFHVPHFACSLADPFKVKQNTGNAGNASQTLVGNRVWGGIPSRRQQCLPYVPIPYPSLCRKTGVQKTCTLHMKQAKSLCWGHGYHLQTSKITVLGSCLPFANKQNRCVRVLVTIREEAKLLCWSPGCHSLTSKIAELGSWLPFANKQNHYVGVLATIH